MKEEQKSTLWIVLVYITLFACMVLCLAPATTELQCLVRATSRQSMSQKWKGAHGFGIQIHADFVMYGNYSLEG